MTFKKIVMGTWTSKQEEENQESSDKELNVDSMMLKTFLPSIHLGCDLNNTNMVLTTHFISLEYVLS